MKKESFLPTILIIFLTCNCCQKQQAHNESCEEYYVDKYHDQRKIRRIGEEDLLKIEDGWTYDDVVNAFGVGYKYMPIMYYPAKCEDKSFYFFSFSFQKNLTHKLEIIKKGSTGGAYDIVVWPPEHKGKTLKELLRENYFEKE